MVKRAALIYSVVLNLFLWPAALCALNRDVCASCTYTTIQSALNNAADGDLIRVAAGSSTENIDIQKSNWNISLHGGYLPDFSARSAESIINGYLRVSVFNSGSALIDRFTVQNSSSSGIVSESTDTAVTITNCKAHHNAGFGIYLYAAQSAIVDSNQVYSNGTYGGIQADRARISGNVQITNNQIYDHSCSYCAGIVMSAARSGDVIDGNQIYSNETGIRAIYLTSTSAPQISNNLVYDNTEYGMDLGGGKISLVYNLVRDNGFWGVHYYGSLGPQIFNNIFARNENYGLHFVTGSGAPLIRNNIFYHNFYGLAFSGNSAGYGSTSVYPAELSHNIFSNDRMLHMSESVPSYATEVPGAYGDINIFSWSNANAFVDPRFVDAEVNDFHLASDSFAIDEGDVDDDYTLEPAPNGSRINVGLYGNTAEAESSANITLANVEVSFAADDLTLSFDTNTAVPDLWVFVEYWDGSAFQPINPADLSGDSYLQGYRGARVQAGAGIELLWSEGRSFLNGLTSSSQIRVRLEHGSQSVSASSSSFSLLQPTATATASPTSTPVPDQSAQPTATPEAGASPAPTPIPSATPTPSINRLKIQARPSRSVLGQKIRLTHLVEFGANAHLNLVSTLSIRAKAIRLRSKRVVGPLSEVVEVDFGKQRLPLGQWRYCTRAYNGKRYSNKSCSSLKVMRVKGFLNPTLTSKI